MSAHIDFVVHVGSEKLKPTLVTVRLDPQLWLETCSAHSVQCRAVDTRIPTPRCSGVIRSNDMGDHGSRVARPVGLDTRLRTQSHLLPQNGSRPPTGLDPGRSYHLPENDNGRHAPRNRAGAHDHPPTEAVESTAHSAPERMSRHRTL